MVIAITKRLYWIAIPVLVLPRFLLPPSLGSCLHDCTVSLLQYSMTPRQADPNYPIGGDPARYSHFKRFLEAAFPTFSSLLAAAEAFAGLPEQTTYTRTELEQALSASTDPACALVDMDLLTTNSPVTPKDAGTLPVDWQSRIPALRGFWRAVQAHPGCFALLTAMTANRAKASLLSKDGVPTLSGELVSQRHSIESTM